MMKPSKEEVPSNSPRNRIKTLSKALSRSNAEGPNTLLDYESSFEQLENAPENEEIRKLGEFLDNSAPEILKMYDYIGRKEESEELRTKFEAARVISLISRQEAKTHLQKVLNLDFKRPKRHLQLLAKRAK